jgi:hypothetical protein
MDELMTMETGKPIIIINYINYSGNQRIRINVRSPWLGHVCRKDENDPCRKLSTQPYGMTSLKKAQGY